MLPKPLHLGRVQGRGALGVHAKLAQQNIGGVRGLSQLPRVGGGDNLAQRIERASRPLVHRHAQPGLRAIAGSASPVRRG
jgi:hypothetical protein